MIKKYQKKPVVIEAVQWTGDNWKEINEFAGNFEKGYAALKEDGGILIQTLEGAMTANKDDFIIKGVKGEFYPCKPDIFEQTYEEV